MEKQTKKLFTVRVTGDDKQVLRSVADRLALSKSEIGRRALRIGLETLSRTNLPGSKFDGKKV